MGTVLIVALCAASVMSFAACRRYSASMPMWLALTVCLIIMYASLATMALVSHRVSEVNNVVYLLLPLLAGATARWTPLARRKVSADVAL